MTEYEIGNADIAALEARVKSLENLCHRALLVLYEDDYPTLRQDLRDALGVGESN